MFQPLGLPESQALHKLNHTEFGSGTANTLLGSSGVEQKYAARSVL